MLQTLLQIWPFILPQTRAFYFQASGKWAEPAAGWGFPLFSHNVVLKYNIRRQSQRIAPPLSPRPPRSSASIFGSDPPNMAASWQLVTGRYSKGL